VLALQEKRISTAAMEEMSRMDRPGFILLTAYRMPEETCSG